MYELFNTSGRAAEFAKHLVSCILCCSVGHYLFMFIVLSQCCLFCEFFLTRKYVQCPVADVLGGITPSKFGWGCAAHASEPLPPYFRPDPKFYTLFQTCKELLWFA